LVEYGASPRATIAFCRTARALAVLRGRTHVVPDTWRNLAHRVLRHRLISVSRQPAPASHRMW